MGRPRRQRRLAPETQGGATGSAGGAVLALAGLHEDAAGEEKQQGERAEDDAGDGGAGEVQPGGGGGGGGAGCYVGGGFAEDCVVEGYCAAGGWEVAAACFEGDEDLGS